MTRRGFPERFCEASLTGIVVLVLIVGCAAPPAPPTAAPTDGYPVTVTDALGRTVTISRKPERIVSLAPAVTETLYAIGAGLRVVAVTEADNYPPDVLKLTKFSPLAVNAEAVLAQRPDVVFALGSFHKPTVETLERLGLTVVAPEPMTLDAAADTIEQVGTVVGNSPAAAGVAADFRKRLAAVRARTATLTDRPKVLYVLWDDPLQVAGPGTFIGRMIEDAGGTNVIADLSQQYPRLSDEAVLTRNPDLVIATEQGSSGLPARLAKRPGWEAVTAVRKGRVVTVSEDLVNRPGPRLIEGLEAVEKLIRENR